MKLEKKDPVMEARRRLENVTPLKRDCGRLCGARCCRSLEGEETGMLLFPGEEREYQDLPGWQVKQGARGKLAVCPGTCARAERPLSCRLFPLLPKITEEGIRCVMDLRAGAVCPLSRRGLKALDPAFVEAVRAAGEVLAGDAECAAVLESLAREQADWRELRDMLRGQGKEA
ncbi:MAG: hypothetical protein IJ231_08645 [Clostridia bacterium]|nr:hypothetical protein [Clostridia bacterium]